MAGIGRLRAKDCLRGADNRNEHLRRGIDILNQKIDCTQPASTASTHLPVSMPSDARVEQIAKQGVCGSLQAAHGVSEIGVGYRGAELAAVLVGALLIKEGGFKMRLAGFVVVLVGVIHGIYLVLHGFSEISSSQML